MSQRSNPYDVSIGMQATGLPLRTKLVAALIGLFVVMGSLITLGTFLFAVLILIAGQSQPSPLPHDAWINSPKQKIVLVVGGLFVLLASFSLAGWVIYRILRSQRLTAEVLIRRQELQAAVGELHFAVKEKKRPTTLS